jgi:hypothetical protein
MSILTIFSLSFALGFQMYALLFPKYERMFHELVDIRRGIVLFIVQVGMSVLFMIVVGLLLIQLSSVYLKGKKYLSKFVIAVGLMLCWAVIFMVSRYFYLNPSQQANFNFYLEKLGFLVVGSIPLFQVRLLFFGKSKKKLY